MVKKSTKAKNGMLLQTSGKRKTAVARLTLYKGTGKVKVNRILVNETNMPEYSRLRIMEPIILAGDVAKNYDYHVRVEGGGVSGQADAVRLAIGRALAKEDKSLEKTFASYDRQLLVADVRQKEPYKPNDSKARAKRQKSYR